MRQMTMREANQHFSQVVREVQESGESVQVLRMACLRPRSAPLRRRRSNAGCLPSGKKC